ncbi:MAG: hypothetical protein ACRDTJ_30930, partial [Pseudonocardiaceae bacterium]
AGRASCQVGHCPAQVQAGSRRTGTPRSNIVYPFARGTPIKHGSEPALRREAGTGTTGAVG